MEAQLDFLNEVLPDTDPHWGGSGFWCCPRCWQSQLQRLRIMIGLTFGPEMEYRIGRCRDCGYWAKFEHAFGSEKGKLRRKGKVIDFGRDPKQAKEV